jgi:dTMP kinase
MTGAGGTDVHNQHFITFEGGEGAGKSTQIRLLAARLREIAREIVVTREPGGTALAEKLRAFILSGKARELGPLGEAVLFSAARIDHIDSLIAPALARGAYVLCDRFSDSTRAYQGVKGGVTSAQLQALEKVTLHGLAPGLTFILDLPPRLGLERAQKRRGGGGADRFEAEDLDFHAQLRARYLDIARAEPDRCQTIDATLPSEAVADAIWSAFCQKQGIEPGRILKQWA